MWMYVAAKTSVAGAGSGNCASFIPIVAKFAVIGFINTPMAWEMPYAREAGLPPAFPGTQAAAAGRLAGVVYENCRGWLPAVFVFGIPLAPCAARMPFPRRSYHGRDTPRRRGCA